MANKADRFYFENFIAATEQSRAAAHYLVECLTEYDASKLSTMLETMHAIEHEADTLSVVRNWLMKVEILLAHRLMNKVALEQTYTLHNTLGKQSVCSSLDIYHLILD